MNVLARICQSASAADLPVVLIGGHAVIAHGYQRNTFDIDLVCRQTLRPAWIDLLKGLGYEIFSERDTFVQTSSVEKNGLDVDLMFVNDATFEKLLLNSKPLEAVAPNARCVSLEHLLAMKCHALKHTHERRTMKDLDDVIQLVEINRLDLDEPKWRELFLKHGTQKDYETIRRISKGGH